MLTKKLSLAFAPSGVALVFAGTVFIISGGAKALARQVVLYDPKLALGLPLSDSRSGGLMEYPAERTVDELMAHMASLDGEYVEQFDITVNVSFGVPIQLVMSPLANSPKSLGFASFPLSCGTLQVLAQVGRAP